MTRFVAGVACLIFLAAPATATSTFSKTWKAKYVDEEKLGEESYKVFRRAGCYICHVKGEDKEEVRNEYGMAVRKFLKNEDFPKDWVEENPEEAEKRILEGFKKANELESKAGEKFGDKIKAGKLPADDSKYEP